LSFWSETILYFWSGVVVSTCKDKDTGSTLWTTLEYGTTIYFLQVSVYRDVHINTPPLSIHIGIHSLETTPP
jgi:hypothetical protein